MPLRIEISLKTFLAAACVGGTLWLLIHLWQILLLIVVALIVVGTISPLVEALDRRGVRRGWSVAAVFVGFWGSTVVLCLVAAPPLWKELLHFIEEAPAIQAGLAGLLSHNRVIAPLGDAVRGFRLEKLVAGDASSAISFSTGIAAVIGYATTSFVLALYIVADRDRARGTLYALAPRRYHLRLARILQNLETIVGGYMRGQLITSVAMALFVFALLTACRVPGALAVAAFAGLADVIPFVGGLMATIPAVLAASRISLSCAGIVLGALVVYMQFESRLLVPRVYGRAMRLPSTAVVLALLIGGKLLGMVGALLALPIAAGLRMIFEELRFELPGDDSDDTARDARDARDERRYDARSHGSSPEEAGAVASEVAMEGRIADAADAVAVAIADAAAAADPPAKE